MYFKNFRFCSLWCALQEFLEYTPTVVCQMCFKYQIASSHDPLLTIGYILGVIITSIDSAGHLTHSHSLEPLG
jgi:hypothetical protein